MFNLVKDLFLMDMEDVILNLPINKRSKQLLNKRLFSIMEDIDDYNKLFTSELIEFLCSIDRQAFYNKFSTNKLTEIFSVYHSVLKEETSFKRRYITALIKEFVL